MNPIESKKKLTFPMPKDNLGIDYFADLLREPLRSTKVFKKIAFNERVHLIKISEFEKRKLKLINSRYVEKRRLIERLNYYEEKIQRLRSQTKSVSNFEIKTAELTDDNKPRPVQFLTRSQSMLIEKETNEKFSQLILTESDKVKEKKKSFLTSMEKFEREGTNSSISLLPNEPTRFKTGSKKQLNVRFQMDQEPVLTRSKTFFPTSLPYLIEKKKSNSDLSNSNTSSLNDTKKPSLKEMYSIPSHLTELLPAELADFDTPSFMSHRLHFSKKKFS